MLVQGLLPTVALGTGRLRVGGVVSSGGWGRNDRRRREVSSLRRCFCRLATSLPTGLVVAHGELRAVVRVSVTERERGRERGRGGGEGVRAVIGRESGEDLLTR